MADYAHKPDVNLKINSELENAADRILRDEQDLKDLEEIIVKYMAANKNSKPEDWLRTGTPKKRSAKRPRLTGMY